MLSNRLYSLSPIVGAIPCVICLFSCSSDGGSSDGALTSAGSGSSAGSPSSAGTSSRGGAPAVSGGTDAGGESSGGAPSTGGTAASVAGSGVSDGAGSSTGGANGVAGAPAAGGSASTAGSSGGSDVSRTFPASDAFDGTALDPSWTVFRPDLADIAVADGTLSIVPHSGALWYQASQADLVYKLVTGDFKATTTVHARKASNRTQTPTQFADVGGIMARNPSGPSENYILGVVGYAEMNQLAVEHKSTTNNKSVYGEVAFTPDAEFRMCRQGSTFTIYYRHPGDSTWGPAFAPFERPDLPATVQVGAIAYTGASSPDFVAIFDNFSFEPVGAGCTQ